MDVLKARKVFRRVTVSLLLVTAGILILSFLLRNSPTEEIYTGEFLVNQPPFPMALAMSLMSTGIILLVMRNY